MTFDAIESYKTELRAAGNDPELLKMCAQGAIAHARLVEGELLEARTLLTRMEINLNEQTEKIVRLIGERDAARHSRDAAQKVTDAALIQLGKVGRALRDLIVVLESHDLIYRDIEEAMSKAKALLPPETP
jgi:hypothetical protein